MAKQIPQALENEEVQLLRNQLSPDEVFLLGFLKGFDRKITQEWEDEGLWELYMELE